MKYDSIETGKRIKTLRKNRGLTQEQLADILCVTDGYVRKLESGIKTASIEILVNLAECLHVSLDYLILGKTSSEEELTRRIDAAIAILSGKE